MDGSARQQAYDRGHTIFSPDGRLYQVEYARNAVERGSPSLGVVTDEGVVLAARKRVRSPLLEPETVTKLFAVDDHVAVASAGHAADARQLIEVARATSQHHRLRYDERMPVESLTTALADHVQEYTQTGGSRPFGSALLVAGVDERGPRLFEVDPSGTPYGWRGVAIGSGASDLRGTLEDELGADGSVPDLDRGLELALEVLTTAAEENPPPEEVAAWLVSAASSERVGTAELEDALAGVAS